jgi:PAS domain S-box-containing protein
LVVEDEAIVAHDIVRQLERFGHRVVADTPRGEEAVELVAKLRPDLVLMDIQLAGAMDGIDAALAIRHETSVPLVFLTAFATEKVLQRAKQASPFGYLVKPFETQQLETAIEIALHQHEVETSLRESREELATILRTANDAFFFGDTQGRLLDVNEATCALLGYAREELLALTVMDLAPDQTPKEFSQTISRILTSGSARFERRLRRKDGSFVEVEMTANKLPIGEGRIMSFARDISARKRADEERDATVRLLGLINQPNSLDALMREVTVLLRDWSGCSAVGIRLSDGEDFPYYETRGFPPAFVQAERYLCSRDRDGRVARDAVGNPVLDCMCGNVLCGRFDPSKPFFTGRGSFWTNSTTRLLASTTEADRQGRTRNR